MLSWDTIVNRTLQEEGGYSNDPDDPGGETMWGITKRVAMINGFMNDMKNMSRDTAIGIYFKEYWTKPRFSDLNPALGFQLFDFGVNHGQGGATKILQNILKVSADGQIGNQTLAAVSGWNLPSLMFAFVAARQNYYLNSPMYGHDGKGWLSRCTQCLNWASQDLLASPPIPSTWR